MSLSWREERILSQRKGKKNPTQEDKHNKVHEISLPLGKDIVKAQSIFNLLRGAENIESISLPFSTEMKICMLKKQTKVLL